MGIGTSGREFIEGVRKLEFQPPVKLLREYLAELRAVPDFEALGMDADDPRIAVGSSGAAPRLIGAIGPNMLNLVRESCDGTLTYSMPPEHTRWARGVFSNESGLGSAAIAHAAAQTNSPVRQGIIAMLGTFIDTLVVCTMTAFLILVSCVTNTLPFSVFVTQDTSIRAMMTFQALPRALALFGIYAGLTACYPELGGVKTGAELAPSLDALREVAPGHHRRLADGTFDTLSIPEQLDLVAEVQAIGRDHRSVEREKSRAERRRLAVEFLDSIKTLTPESAEEVLQANRIWLLEDLKFESDWVAMEDSFFWIERHLAQEGG